MNNLKGHKKNARTLVDRVQMSAEMKYGIWLFQHCRDWTFFSNRGLDVRPRDAQPRHDVLDLSRIECEACIVLAKNPEMVFIRSTSAVIEFLLTCIPDGVIPVVSLHDVGSCHGAPAPPRDLDEVHYRSRTLFHNRGEIHTLTSSKPKTVLQSHSYLPIWKKKKTFVYIPAIVKQRPTHVPLQNVPDTSY